jgi:hypothetical protein
VDKFAGTIGYFIAPIFIVLAYIGTLIWTFAYLAFISFIIWFGSVIFKRTWSYQQIYTVGLFALTAPVMVSLFLRVVGIGLPFVHSTMLVCLVIFAMRKEKASDLPDPSIHK